MLISPILNPKKLYKPLDTDNLSLKNLLHEAAIRKEGAILSFLPDVNVEQSAFQNIELCTHILYYNFRQLLRLPTLGNVDQKNKYSSIYNSATTMRQFFGGRGLKMINYRVVVELMILYGLTAKDLKVMSRWCCKFTYDDSSPATLNYGNLTGIYTKKQVVAHIQKHINSELANQFPARVLKGMEYISYADFLHVFRSVGQDPYAVFQVFANKAAQTLGVFDSGSFTINAFDVVHLDKASQPKTKNSPVQANQTKGNAVEPRFAEVINQAIKPMGRTHSLHVMENIQALRDANSQVAAGFDSLFVHSGCSKLDVFNYLARISVAYGVSMRELFYSTILPGQYHSRKEFAVVEYTLDEIKTIIRDGLQLDIGIITDDNFFDKLSNCSSDCLLKFGYLPDEEIQPCATALVSQNLKTQHEPPPAKSMDDNKTQQDSTNSEHQTDKEAYFMNISLKLRICLPCDPDAWENDNPDRNSPGFHWTDADENTVSTATASIESLCKGSVIDFKAIRAAISKIVQKPFKARIQASSAGIKANIDLY